MKTPPQVRIGVVGSGFAAHFHLASYRKVYGENFAIVAIASRNGERAGALAKQFAIPKVCADFEALLADLDVDAIDLCTPNRLHIPMAMAAARAGKHVFCEKPLGGFFGPDDNPDWSADCYPRAEMRASVLEQMRGLSQIVAQSGITFGYGENWVYAPPIVKLNRLMAASGSTILRIEGEESHSGSHSPFSRRWRDSGGGSLARLCVHPIGAALHLKAEEGRRTSGAPIRPVSVLCQVANLTAMARFRAEDPKHIAADWVDVEDFASILITFEDGAVAQLTSTDTRLGGIRNFISAYGSRAIVTANINPNNACQAYTPDGRYFADEYLVEKLETKQGWSFPAPDEDAITGYPDELRDFIAAVSQRRQPISDLRLAMDVLAVVYAGYQSAEAGARVMVGGEGIEPPTLSV